MGFRQVQHGPKFWMRVEAGGPPWRVSLAMDARQMGKVAEHGGEMHVCWWEGDPRGDTVYAESEALRSISERDLPCVLWLDDDGRRLARQRHPTPTAETAPAKEPQP
jgi:hypothetical protein